MSSLNASDLSVVIPVRIDSPDRRRNLNLVLAHLGRWMSGHETIVIEHDPEPELAELGSARNLTYVPVADAGCFHKSRLYNLGAAMSGRPYLLLCDADVLFDPEAIRACLDALRAGAADVAYPYNGVMLELRCETTPPQDLFVDVASQRRPPALGHAGEALPAGLHHLHGSSDAPSTGGGVLVERRIFFRNGGFNPNITSYGCEDTEFLTRQQRLGARVMRATAYNCYHIHHRRGPDSHYNNFHRANLAEWRKVEAMDETATRAYVDRGFRELVMDSSQRLRVRNTPHEFSLTVEPAPGARLENVDFVVPLVSGNRLLEPYLVEFLERIERTYDGHRVIVLELGGNDYRALTHCDHVIHESLNGGGAYEWLDAARQQVNRDVVCLCDPLTDVSPDVIMPAVAQVVRDQACVLALALAEVAPSGRNQPPRENRIRAVLARHLPLKGRPRVFSRAAFGDGQADAPNGEARTRALAIRLGLESDRGADDSGVGE